MKDKIKVGDFRPTFLQLCRNSRIPKNTPAPPKTLNS